MQPFEQTKIEDNLNVWQEFKNLGNKYNGDSLGEGGPHFKPPQFLVDNLVKSIEEGHNGYTSCFGHPLARGHIAEMYQDRFNEEIDPAKNVMICNGANSCINVVLNTLVNPGDEVILIEPMFP